MPRVGFFWGLLEFLSGLCVAHEERASEGEPMAEVTMPCARFPGTHLPFYQAPDSDDCNGGGPGASERRETPGSIMA